MKTIKDFTDKIHPGLLFKIVWTGYFFLSIIPAFIMGIVTAFSDRGSEVFSWGNMPVHGIAAFFASLLFALFMDSLLTIITWVYLVGGTWIYRGIKNLILVARGKKKESSEEIPISGLRFTVHNTIGQIKSSLWLKILWVGYFFLNVPLVLILTIVTPYGIIPPPNMDGVPIYGVQGFILLMVMFVPLVSAGLTLMTWIYLNSGLWIYKQFKNLMSSFHKEDIKLTSR